MPEPRKSRLVPEVDFDRDGKQTGFIRLFHSTHDSAYGFLPIPIVVVKNGEGPTAFFSSGNHGDEYEGQVALTNLIKWLEPGMIKGRVIMLPMANYPAALIGRRVSPIDDLNMNRIFPGDPDGTVTRQIAHYIDSELITRADLVIDLHSGGSSLNYIPTALAKQSADPALYAKQLAALRAFGAPYTYIQGGAQGQGGDQTLGSGADRRGRISLGTELGGAGAVNASGLAIAERGLRNLLVHLGILGREHWVEPPVATRFLDVRGPEMYVYAPENGVFEPLVELGDEVVPGTPAARIHMPETPWLPPVEIAFKAAGIVMCKRIPARTKRGDCLFHLASDLPV
ncbi:succinylglutamate desuccinylase/aspartoacylase family protein [Roseomonas sp. PWR1]|uniref:Succinylglutamate desuccinylase/aspartoacylase family protein n=1 Tax=Roseomonas nitratireducens TaxID=2820810 RepID=A0ABS4ANX0_9PROT|nr:succinylglutamate desuccinylase/aspartoacylase family protein [Neoroseomonas nitratireducens]MBP0463060.1 succinylglutamate desuccinylase/aspartoacylase family protein [Neoroseomonas nitratireducens]